MGPPGAFLDKFVALGIDLDGLPVPAGTYVPTVRSGNLLVVSGQLPMRDGAVLYTGPVDDTETSLARGVEAARLCAGNILAQAHAALGGLHHVTRVVRLGGFVQSATGMTKQPLVINGASDMMVEWFGDAIGRHARAAVGVSALPLDASVEIEALFEVQ